MPLSLRIALSYPLHFTSDFSKSVPAIHTNICHTIFPPHALKPPLAHTTSQILSLSLPPSPSIDQFYIPEKAKTCWFQKVKYTYDSPINSLHPPYLPPQDSMLPKKFQSIAYFTPLKESIFPHKTFLSTIGIEIAT